MIPVLKWINRWPLASSPSRLVRTEPIATLLFHYFIVQKGHPNRVDRKRPSSVHIREGRRKIGRSSVKVPSLFSPFSSKRPSRALGIAVRRRLLARWSPLATVATAALTRIVPSSLASMPRVAAPSIATSIIRPRSWFARNRWRTSPRAHLFTPVGRMGIVPSADRKSTRLNSSHWE